MSNGAVDPIEEIKKRNEERAAKLKERIAAGEFFGFGSAIDEIQEEQADSSIESEFDLSSFPPPLDQNETDTMQDMTEPPPVSPPNDGLTSGGIEIELTPPLGEEPSQAHPPAPPIETSEPAQIVPMEPPPDIAPEPVATQPPPPGELTVEMPTQPDASAPQTLEPPPIDDFGFAFDGAPPVDEFDDFPVPDSWDGETAAAEPPAPPTQPESPPIIEQPTISQPNVQLEEVMEVVTVPGPVIEPEIQPDSPIEPIPTLITEEVPSDEKEKTLIEVDPVVHQPTTHVPIQNIEVEPPEAIQIETPQPIPDIDPMPPTATELEIPIIEPEPVVTAEPVIPAAKPEPVAPEITIPVIEPEPAIIAEPTIPVIEPEPAIIAEPPIPVFEPEPIAVAEPTPIQPTTTVDSSELVIKVNIEIQGNNVRVHRENIGMEGTIKLLKNIVEKYESL